MSSTALKNFTAFEFGLLRTGQAGSHAAHRPGSTTVASYNMSLSVLPMPISF